MFEEMVSRYIVVFTIVSIVGLSCAGLLNSLDVTYI